MTETSIQTTRRRMIELADDTSGHPWQASLTETESEIYSAGADLAALASLLIAEACDVTLSVAFERLKTEFIRYSDDVDSVHARAARRRNTMGVLPSKLMMCPSTHDFL